MNLPNIISLIRIGFVPVIIVLAGIPGQGAEIASGFVFGIAFFLDFLDGKIARSQNKITDFGKMIDPIADKILMLSSMIIIVQLGLIPAWFVIVVLFRELSVDALRMIISSKGRILAAGKIGKYKTGSQAIMIAWFLFTRLSIYESPVSMILMIIVLITTLLSGADYFKKNMSGISFK